MSNTSQPDTDQTADLAKSSGLFGSPAPTQQKTPAKTTKPTKTQKITTNTPLQDQPCDSGELKTPKNTQKQPENADSQQSTTPDVFNPSDFKYTLQELHDALNLTWSDKSKRYSTIRQIYVALNRFHALKERYAESVQPDGSQPRARVETPPPTREELISIVSAALRAENATGSDVKGLTATLQSLLPALFAPTEQSKRPDPAAIIGYITTFAGRKGDEIVQELGGSEFIETKLSEVLKVPVKLVEQPFSGA